jgi:hypothetical protein
MEEYRHPKRKNTEDYKGDVDFKKWIDAWSKELESFWELI